MVCVAYSACVACPACVDCISNAVSNFRALNDIAAYTLSDAKIKCSIKAIFWPVWPVLACVAYCGLFWPVLACFGLYGLYGLFWPVWPVLPVWPVPPVWLALTKGVKSGADIYSKRT